MTAHSEILPQEILERDYGCGDPSQFVRPGEVVLDLGSGGGKICYIVAQIVGPQGKVIGVDMNDDMLGLARKYQDEMAEKIGARNVEFRKGKIQDLRLDLDEVDEYLRTNPIRSSADLQLLESIARRCASIRR
jgi:ubiquinone/menaquinone biosynthesis C-methylase UbiE